MRLLSALFTGLLLVGIVAAQDSPSPYEIALERIREAERTGATYLDLSDLGLTELPSEIFLMSNLKTLVVSRNELIELSSEIARLSNLEELYIDSNERHSLPPRNW